MREQALWQEVQTLRGKLDSKNKQLSNLRISVDELREANKEVAKIAAEIAKPNITMTVQWKPIVDGLPGNSLPVLVKNNVGSKFVAWYNLNRGWVCSGCHKDGLAFPVTHWMELPE